MAIVGLKMMHDDVKHTINDYSIQKPPHSVSKQKQEIDKCFINIVEYCGVKCDVVSDYNGAFRKFGVSTRYNIKNVQKGEYGILESYLFKMGYSKEAIDYCKQKIDNVANKENNIQSNAQQQRIKDYENALKTQPTKKEAYVVDIASVHLPKHKVEERCKKLSEYFDKAMNYNTICNIVMGGDHPNINHTETWLILEPQGYDFTQYYDDICSQLQLK